jgi:hypothetical protein
MECGGVWFAGSKFGLTWRAKQIAVHKLPEKIGDFAFKGLGSAPPEEKDMDDVFAPATTASAASASTASASTASASVVAAFMPQAPVAKAAEVQAPVAEEDEEDGEDMEPVPPPKPMIKKKMVVGKK